MKTLGLTLALVVGCICLLLLVNIDQPNLTGELARVLLGKKTLGSGIDNPDVQFPDVQHLEDSCTSSQTECTKHQEPNNPTPHQEQDRTCRTFSCPTGMTLKTNPEQIQRGDIVEMQYSYCCDRQFSCADRSATKAECEVPQSVAGIVRNASSQ